jgi:uncharacterized GH25 family protein
MRRYLTISSLGLFVALRLGAHDTWLQPTVSAVAPGDIINLTLTSANGFKGAEKGPAPERVHRAFLRLADVIVPLDISPASEKVLGFSAKPGLPGVGVCAVELKPRDLELPPHLIQHYFDEIHAGEALRRQWLEVPEPRRWRERYIKVAKTFVRVGDPSVPAKDWSEPNGLTLEILPERDPTTLQVGDLLPVRVLRNGTPLAEFTLGFVAEGETHHHVVTTDADGRAAAPVDRPGLWLVHGTDLWRSQQEGCEWESVFTTLVVEVAARKR